MLMPLMLSENVLQTNRLNYAILLHPQRWRQKISAIGWYDWAKFQVLGDRLELERWFSDYLGWHAVRHDPTGLDQEPIFEGLVWTMTLNLPGMTQTISLDDMENEVAVRYTPTDFAPNPPTTSDPAVTAFASNADSQAKYGIKEGWLQRGRMNSTMAEQERDTWLEEYAWPKAQKRVSSSNRLMLDVTLKGYWHTAEWQTREYTGGSTTENASFSISSIDDSIEYRNASIIETNTVQVPIYYKRTDEIRRIGELFQWTASLGDANNDRWIVGMKKDRTLYYQAAATGIPTYWRLLADPAHVIRHSTRGHIVQPWLVRPDHVLRTADINSLGSMGITPWSKDPQVQYIESVEWSEPYGLRLEDSRGQRIETLLAKNVQRGEEAFRREFA